MLHLLLGRTGTGKTQEIYRLISEYAREGEKGMILIVPEQFSFASERAVLHTLGAKDASRVEILSFTRLADAVFREYGGMSGKKVSDAGRAVLMSLALEGVQEKLELYRRHALRTDMIASLLHTADEFKMSCISPDMLSEVSAGIEDGTLKKKTGELALILSAYDALVAQSYYDERDILTRLYEILLEHRFFEGRVVFIDAFKGYTPQEMRILSRIFSDAREVYLTLGTDSLTDKEDGIGVFSPLKKAGNRLLQLAKKYAVKVASPVIFSKQRRFQNDALAVLESGLFDPLAQPYEEKENAVTLCAAQNVYEECDYIASAIKKLLRTENMRCKDIAVIARNAEDYRPILTAAFEKYEIPFFNDNRQPVDTQPLMTFIRYVFELLNGGTTDTIFHYLKTGLTGLSVEEISLLENYTFTWDITARQWEDEWTEHPDGFGVQFSEEDVGKLNEINRLRANVIAPILRFKQNAEGKNGGEITRELFFFLEHICAAEYLKNLAKQFASNGETELAQEQGRLWDLFINLLDEMAQVLNERAVSVRRYGELLNLVISLQDIGSIPQGIDEAAFGSADRMRPAQPKAVFVIGANDGIFPAAPSSAGLLSDIDRRTLADMGLELPGGLQEQTVEEWYLAYSALCAASEKLYVTYARTDSAGKALSPSVIVSQIKRILPKCRMLDTSMLDSMDWLEAKKPAFEWTARHWHENSGLETCLKDYFSGQEGYQRQTAAVMRAAEGIPFSINDSGRAKALFGENMYVSASRIENYYQCRFAYFCRYGLGVRAVRPARLDAVQTGTVIHFVLERLIRQYGGKGMAQLSDEILEQEICSLLSSYLEECMGGSENKTARFHYLFHRIVKTLLELVSVLRMEFSQSMFEPVDFELSIEHTGDIPPYILSLPGGGTVAVRGKVDRVDIMHSGGVAYVRVIDYKSGTKKFQLSDVLSGLNMQMLIYLFAIIRNGGERYGDMIPAGVLYMPARRPEPSLGRHAGSKEIEKEKIKSVAMNGIVLDDPMVVHGMEKDGKGLFIPVKITADGETSGTIIRLAQMGKLQAKIDALITDMAQSLHAGKIQAFPVSSGNYHVCDWCDFHSVCGHSDEDACNHIPEYKHFDALKALEGEEDNG